MRPAPVVATILFSAVLLACGGPSIPTGVEPGLPTDAARLADLDAGPGGARSGAPLRTGYGHGPWAEACDERYPAGAAPAGEAGSVPSSLVDCPPRPCGGWVWDPRWGLVGAHGSTVLAGLVCAHTEARAPLEE